MNFSKITKAIGTSFKAAKNTVNKYSPEIFAGAGIGLFIASGVLAVINTPKANKELEEAKDKTTVEKVKIVAKNYAVPIAGTLSATACVIKSVSTSTKRYVALSAAYSLTEETLRTYKDKVIETVGEKKAKDIDAKVSQEQVNNNPPKVSGIITPTMNLGPSLFYEPISKVYFWGDINSVKRACHELADMELNTQDNCVSVYEFLQSLGLTESIDDQELNTYMNLGWCLSDDMHVVTVDLNPIEARGLDGRACNALSYSIPPAADYNIFCK